MSYGSKTVSGHVTGTIVVYENKIWKVIGTHNRGASVRITNGQPTFSRSPKKLKHKLHINSLILTQEVAIPPLS